MRYYATAISHYHTVQFSWRDFESCEFYSEVAQNLSLMSLGRLFSGYILADGALDSEGRFKNWDESSAINFAFFLSYASKTANYREWTKVRSWFGDQPPAVQQMLVRARVWFQTGARQRKFMPWDPTPHGAILMADLNDGAVVMATHVDHSDC